MKLNKKGVHKISCQTHVPNVPWSREKVIVVGLSAYKWKSETGFQIYCMTWLRKQYLITGEEKYNHWHHSPNEGLRSSLTGLILKLMGMSRGYPDLTQAGLKLALELKLPGKPVSKEQLEWLAYFKSIGWHSECVRSFERFREVVEGV